MRGMVRDTECSSAVGCIACILGWWAFFFVVEQPETVDFLLMFDDSVPDVNMLEKSFNFRCHKKSAFLNALWMFASVIDFTSIAFVCRIGCVGSGASQRVYPDWYWKLRQNSNLKGTAFILCETSTLNYIITILFRRVWRRHSEPLFSELCSFCKVNVTREK